ncbi:Hypothetical protein IALB_0626 [Ignavibacterium album JCM 16511]|uniref:Uncharacterized protein n=1 Tax=Ignavibacterium album (strain DSM 19864 / JCM 16511 / NBRC 101810 / Mat9-16) TaxID=945713 RepID=I0AH81_IGNAJ|nr:hypothetical protein [Ignavibacterium album]AFH48338.1 Hypothetical protein IALB_0626 [Ignavibacterium album JCM 16511]
MKLDAKTIYAQSSDIKSRTFLEYRRDMKKKAIAELEIIDWLKDILKEKNPNKNVKVYKSGGDKFVWFLRKGGVTREPDFIADISGEKIEFEFQYAEKSGLDFYDFKVSKVTKKKGNIRKPIENKFFIYVIKSEFKYGIFKPDWIFKNGEYGMVEAWRSYAYRVPRNKFERELKKDHKLEAVIKIIDTKNFILNFQQELIDYYKNKLSRDLQSVIDENNLVKIIPYELESFFKVCFILDNINKIPQNANLWLVYLLSFIKEDLDLENIAKIVYALDFLYTKIQLTSNELSAVIENIKKLLTIINKYYQNDGSYKSSKKLSPLDETRYALFAINILEDIVQDSIYYYSVNNLKPITKIYENIIDVEKTFRFISHLEKI